MVFSCDDNFGLITKPDLPSRDIAKGEICGRRNLCNELSARSLLKPSFHTVAHVAAVALVSIMPLSDNVDSCDASHYMETRLNLHLCTTVAETKLERS